MSFFEYLVDGPKGEFRSLRERVFPSEQRRPGGMLGLVITVVCVVFTLGTIYMAFNVTFGPIPTRAGHLLFALPLTFLLYPAFSRRSERPTFFDYVFAAAAIASFGWAVYSADRFDQRMAFSGRVDPIDLVMGIIGVIVILEAARRQKSDAAFGQVCVAVQQVSGPGL